jgi:hypothetical protein
MITSSAQSQEYSVLEHRESLANIAVEDQVAKPRAYLDIHPDQVPRVIALHEQLDFGKHKGKEVYDIILDHPSYIRWIWENDVRVFDSETLAMMRNRSIIE